MNVTPGNALLNSKRLQVRILPGAFDKLVGEVVRHSVRGAAYSKYVLLLITPLGARLKSGATPEPRQLFFSFAKEQTMFSVRQKREIAEKVQIILRGTGHPELPDGEIQFQLNVKGETRMSWAVILNNEAVTSPSVNPHNEAQDPTAAI